MIDRIKSFFAKNILEPEETVTSEQIAVAALLIEVMVIDGNLDARGTGEHQPDIVQYS